MALGNARVKVPLDSEYPTTAEIDELARQMAQYQYAPQNPRRDCMEIIANSLERQTSLMERQCMVEERTLHTMYSILDKQNEIVKQLTADTRIAELKAHKWEEHALRLQGELGEARRG